eukprot:1160443-Pelagomonas_calceolata.AAC.18
MLGKLMTHCCGRRREMCWCGICGYFWCECQWHGVLKKVVCQSKLGPYVSACACCPPPTAHMEFANYPCDTV